MFIDLVTIKIASGKGGDGSNSFRREKCVPKGGPDGGDGGRGGHILILAGHNLTTLVDLHNNRMFSAAEGGKGYGARMHGRNAQDITIMVPVGTLVRDARTGAIIKDLIKDGDTVMAAEGGRGGRGNWHFRTSTRQAPRFYEKGEPGEHKDLTLELKILADVGIIGIANAGKSTLLSKISNAHPKIADYPFTTLTPVLGIVKYSDTVDFVVADIPGLIEGASHGKGLGFDFLRHIERTRLYIHVVDPTQGGAYKTYTMINKELKAYNKELLDRPQVVVINKTELLSEKEIKKIKADFKKRKIRIDFISAREKIGLDKLLNRVYNTLKSLPPALPYTPDEAVKEADPISLEKIEDGVYRLHSKKVEKFTAMLDFKEYETLEVFRRYLEREGLNNYFRQQGLKTGDVIVIGERDFVFEEE